MYVCTYTCICVQCMHAYMGACVHACAPFFYLIWSTVIVVLSRSL